MRAHLNSIDLFGTALGVFATVSQVVLMREALGITGGNELAVSLGFAAWLVGVGLGALLAVPASRRRHALMAGSLAATGLVAAGLLLLRLHRMVLELPLGVDPTILGLTGLLAAGVGCGGLSTGFLFTVAARTLPSGLVSPVSRLYTAEAVGALVGGLVLTAALSEQVPHLLCVGTIGVLLTAASLGWTRGKTARAIGAGGALLLIGATLFGPVGRLSQATLEKAVSLIREGRLVAIAESPYGRLALVEREEQFEVLVDGRFDHAFPDPWERPVPVHLALSQHPHPKRVLLVGGGPSDRLEAVLAHRPDRVVLTYLDHRIHEMCLPYWPVSTKRALGDPRVEVVRDDGRRYISKTDRRFDVVLVAARPPQSAGANRYHTLAFYQAVRRILAPGGSMSAMTEGSANVLAPEAAREAASTVATVRKVFKEVVVVPGLDLIIHASDAPGVVSADPAVLAERYRARGVQARSFSWHRFQSIYDPARMAELQAQLAPWPAVLNTDAHPLVYLAALQLWERSMSRAGETSVRPWTGALERTAWFWLIVPLIVFAVWRAFRFMPGRRGQGGTLFPIATTGAAGMAAEVVILYTFQAAEGTLYTALALLVAVFMAGLTTGAFLGRRYLARGRTRDGIIADAGMLLFCLLSAVMLSSITVDWVVAIPWSLAAGAATGAAFPAMLGRTAASGVGDERLAAVQIEAADHLGAAFGALVTGVIWIPVFGVVPTCLLFGLIKAASLVSQLRFFAR